MSTASRTLWSDSWGIFLIGWVVLTLARLDADQDQPPPMWLATLLSWSYFVRPTNSVAIVGVTVYLLACHREMRWRYILWLTGFMTFAWYNFGHLLPSYFQPSRLAPAYPLRGLLANLISPSRGVIVFVPTLMLVAYLLTRYWTYLPHRHLVMVALGILPFYLVAVSSYWRLSASKVCWMRARLADLCCWCVDAKTPWELSRWSPVSSSIATARSRLPRIDGTFNRSTSTSNRLESSTGGIPNSLPVYGPLRNRARFIIERTVVAGRVNGAHDRILARYSHT